jgi:DNA-binding NarL/FixJ family response regulator
VRCVTRLALDPVVDPAGPPVRVALVVERETPAHALRRCLARGGLDVAGGPVTLARIDVLGARHPDALVLAADVTDAGGLAGLRRLVRDMPSTPVVVVVGAAAASRHAARMALNAGAAAYVPEAEAGPTLALAVRAVVAGLVCVPRATRSVAVKPTFSQREKDVLGLLVAGLTNAQIARRLYLAESTVKTHLASAFAKLGVRSRHDAVTLLLDPEEGLAATALPLGVVAARDGGPCPAAGD